MRFLAGLVNIIGVLAPWQAVVQVFIVFMLCVTRVVLAAIRSDGPISRAAAAAFTGWIRRRHLNR